VEVHLNAIEHNTLDYSLKFDSPLHNHSADRFTRELTSVLQEIDHQLLTVEVNLGLHGWIDLFITLKEDEGNFEKLADQDLADKVLQALESADLRSAGPNRSRFAPRVARILADRGLGSPRLHFKINPLPSLPLAVTDASAIHKHH